MVWDTAGQEEFDAITKAYYRGAHRVPLIGHSTQSPPFFQLLELKKTQQTMCHRVMSHHIMSFLFFLSGAQVCIIVFSTVDRESFLAIERWKNKVFTMVETQGFAGKFLGMSISFVCLETSNFISSLCGCRWMQK